MRASSLLALLRLLIALAVVLAFSPTAHAAPDARLLSIDGEVNPVSARYLTREVGRASADGVPLVIVQIDTPGGLASSMREMTQALLGARVPVVAWVAPSGARAASAGMFVVLAANVAAMAPGTEIGAAHPVSLGGGSSDPVMGEKVVNDTAALARALAETRHRNAAWAEHAVRESASITAEEARREGVIDLVAPTTPALLAQLDGRTVTLPDGEHTLRTASVRVEERPMLVTERVLLLVSDPNVAYLLFLLGLLGLAAEVYHPGTFVPGTVGAIALVLALVAFGNLPIHGAGILLLVLAMGLFIAELHTGVGALALAALAALIAGSILLYGPPAVAPPAAARVRVSPWLVAVMATLVSTFFLVVVRATLRARRLAVRTGIPMLVGHAGVATSELAPTGTVRVDSEVWTATSDAGPIHQGEHVEVVGVAGVMLRVTKSPPAHPT